MIDFSARDTFKTTFSVDGNTGLITVTFKSADGLSTLGSVVIETLRFRALTEVLATFAEAYFKENTPGLVGYKTSLDLNGNSATTTFG